MNVEALDFRPMTTSESDLILFQGCFNANGQPRRLETLHWQFREPPPSLLYVDFAVEVGETPMLAAVYATFPIWMRVGSDRILGVQSIDTLTDARYRGKGLFVRMATSLFERCATHDVGLVYGFPNGNSAHGFFSRLGWSALDPVPYLFKPLRLRYITNKFKFNSRVSNLLDVPLTRGRPPRLRVSERLQVVTTFDRDFDTVWATFAVGIQVAVERDAKYLGWRTRRPHENYETIALYERDSLRGYVIIGTNTVSGVSIGKVMELIFDPGDQRLGVVLLSEAVRRLNDRGSEVVWASSFAHSPNHRILRSAGFLPAPQRFRSSETHMGVRALGAVSQDLVSARPNWYVSLLDSDTH